MTLERRSRRAAFRLEAVAVGLALAAAPAPVPGQAVISEPFEQTAGNLHGKAASTNGLTGNWIVGGGAFSVTVPSLPPVGTLPVSGNRVTLSSTANSQAYVAVDTNALAGAGLLADGSSLWFSVVVRTPDTTGSNPDTGFAIGSDPIGSGNNLAMAAGQQALGWTIKNGLLQATFWNGGAATRPGGIAVGTGTKYLIVGEIAWSAGNDTISLYLPDVNLNRGAAVSTTSAALNQAAFDTISTGIKANTGYALDEIRFGATYADVVPGPARAYWDLNGTTAGAGGATPAGTWDAAAGNWSDDSAGTHSTAAWAAGRAAVFAAGTDATGAYAVAVDGVQDVGALHFKNGTVSLADGTLRLVTNAMMVVESGLTATMASGLSEDVAGRGLGKAGGGTLRLSGTNTHSGVTSVYDGILLADTTAALPGYTAPGQITFSGGTLLLPLGAGGWTWAEVDDLAANANLQAGLLGIDTAGGDQARSTPFTLGAVGLFKAGAGALTLSETNSYTGATVIGGGTLVLSNGNDRLPAVTSVTLGDGAGGSGRLQLGTGGGSVTQMIAGLTVSGTGTYNAVVGGNSDVSLLKVNIASGVTATYGGWLGGAGANENNLALAKTGTGVLILTGTNTFGGDIDVAAGVLQIGRSGNLPSVSSLGGGAYAGNISVSTGATLNCYGDARQVLSGVISGGGDLVLSRSTLTLSSNNTYTGKTSIRPQYASAGGTLVVSSFNSVTTDAGLGTVHAPTSCLGAPTNAASGTIDLGNSGAQSGCTLIYTNGAGEVTDRIINLVGNGSGPNKNIVASGTGLLKFTSAFTKTGGSTGLGLGGVGNGEIVGGLPGFDKGLTKSESGVWYLDGAGGYTGVTTVAGGCLMLQHATAIPGGLAAGAAGHASGLTFNGGVLGLGAGDFSRALGGASNQVLFTGNGGWAACNADRLVNLGGASDPVDWAAATNGFNGKTLMLGAASATHRVTLQNPIDLGTAVRTVQVADGAAPVDAALGGDLSGAGGGLAKSGNGTLALTGANSYGGATAVDAGTLVYDGSLSADAGVVTVASGATLAGTGTIARAVTVNDGGALRPGDPAGVLTISNHLTVAAGATLRYALGAVSARTDVAGDLSLAGTLDVVDAGGFAPGTYVLFNYSGSLTYSGVVTGSVPNAAYAYEIDTNTANQVRLIVSGGEPPLPPFDQWRQDYFGPGYATNPLAAADADPLGKDMSNTNQFLADLDPTNAQSRLEIVSVVRTSGADLRIDWMGGGTGAVQVLEGGDRLGDGGVWTNLFECTPATPVIPSVTNHLDLGNVARTNRFYRIRAHRP